MLTPDQQRLTLPIRARALVINIHTFVRLGVDMREQGEMDDEQLKNFFELCKHMVQLEADKCTQPTPVASQNSKS